MLKKIMIVGILLSALVCSAGVDVNTATEAELDSINGIGPAMSSKILAERKKGDFKDWNDFMGRVKGVRKANATKFSVQGMTVNSAAYMDTAPASSANK